ncbi:MAG: cyclic nucleotide-binding domain-containing protein [Persicimonas sp.]
MNLKVWAKSDVGNVRDNNEDNYFADADAGVFAVADGVGGRSRGERASAMVADACADAAADLHRLATEIDAHKNLDARERVLDRLREHLQRTNAAIFSEDLERDDAHGMATTADVVVVSHASAYVAHVGDSRVYLMRDDEIYRVTEDHTYAEHLRSDPRSAVRRLADSDERYEHALTRSIGAKPHVDIDTLYLDVQPGDHLFLCTDGLTDYVDGDEIKAQADRVEPDELVDTLIDLAKERGGRDNITVVCVQIPEERDQDAWPTERSIDTIRQIDFLGQIELFEGLSALELIKVLRTVYERSFGDGAAILEEGDPCDGLYLVVEGEISLTVEGTEVGRVGPGQHFGELAMFTEDRARLATATSDGESLVLVVPAENLEELIDEERDLGCKLLKNLVRHAAGQIRAMNERLGRAARADTLRTVVPPEVVEEES